MSWILCDEAKLLADMPTDLAPLYASWLTANPEKDVRLAEITAGVVSEFRNAIASNPANRSDPAAATLPESCIRSAQALVYGTLQNEMGLDLSTEDTQSMTRAEIFLRQISYGNFLIDGAQADQPSPYYETDIQRPERSLP